MRKLKNFFTPSKTSPKGSRRGCLCKDNTLNDIEEEEAKDMLKHIRRIVKQDGRYKDGQKEVLESYADYPDAVKNNAKRGLELNEAVNNKCATQVGKVRAQQLAQGKPVREETIKRMYSYLSRAEEYYDEGNTEACGTISYLLWGGLAAKRWAESKLKELDLIDLKAPCQAGYEQYGMKEKNGKLVPNCIPIK